MTKNLGTKINKPRILFNYDIEGSVLSSMLQFPAAIEKIDTLTPNHFHKSENKKIFLAIQHLYRQGKQPDFVIVSTYLQETGKLDLVQYLLNVTTEQVFGSRFNTYLQKLSDYYQERQINEVLSTIQHQLNSGKETNEILTESIKALEHIYNDNDNASDIIEMTFDYVVEEADPILTINDIKVLTPGNTMAIIANAGAGKSHTMELIVASLLNENCDTANIRTCLPDDKIILHIDGEREKNDVRYSLDRIKRRAEAGHLIDDETKKFSNYTLIPFVEIESIAAKKQALRKQILRFKNKIGILIIDSITDITLDPNDLKEAQELLLMLVAYSNKYSFGVVVSIHNNNNGTGKPRGHIGSELYRKAQCMLMIKPAEDNPDIKLITTDFSHGKNRSDDHRITTAITWSNEKRMFVSCDYAYKGKTTLSKKVEAFIDAAFEKKDDQFSWADLIGKFMIIHRKSKKTGSRWINQAVKDNLIEKDDSGLYKLFSFTD